MVHLHRFCLIGIYYSGRCILFYRTGKENTSMQMSEAAELRKAWKENGNPPCDHPGYKVKEYHLGTSTGDRVCTICGYADHPDAFKK